VAPFFFFFFLFYFYSSSDTLKLRKIKIYVNVFSGDYKKTVYLYRLHLIRSRIVCFANCNDRLEVSKIFFSVQSNNGCSEYFFLCIFF